MLDTVRACLAGAAFVVLTGGYYAHQWMLFTGRLDEWTARIAGPSNVLGWLLLMSAVALCFWKVEE